MLSRVGCGRLLISCPILAWCELHWDAVAWVDGVGRALALHGLAFTIGCWFILLLFLIWSTFCRSSFYSLLFLGFYFRIELGFGKKLFVSERGLELGNLQ